jgi:hypothetical protein
MQLVYTPEGGEERRWEFEPARLMSVEAELIESVGGEAWDSWPEFANKFISGNRRAYRAALWIFLKRENPRLKFNELVVRVDELDLDFAPDEARKAIEENTELTEQERAELLAELDEAEAESTEAAEPPKEAPAVNGESATASPSPRPASRRASASKTTGASKSSTQRATG